MVLPTFVEQARAGRPLTVFGDGAQVRTFAHVDDVAADLVRLTSMAEVPAGPLNLGGCARATVTELAALVAAQVPGTRLETADPAREVSSRFEEVRSREPDLGRARALGLACACRELSEIVADTLARHPVLA